MTTLKAKIATLTAQGVPDAVAVHQAELLHALQQYNMIMRISRSASKACYWRKKERECQEKGITLEQYKAEAAQRRGRKKKVKATEPAPDAPVTTAE